MPNSLEKTKRAPVSWPTKVEGIGEVTAVACPHCGLIYHFAAHLLKPRLPLMLRCTCCPAWIKLSESHDTLLWLDATAI